MGDQSQNPKLRKVQKKVNSYFQKDDVHVPDISSLDEQEPFVSPTVECQPMDINYIERDPDKRPAISSYDVNEQDNIRKRYVLYGPYQPKLEAYPSHPCGDQDRRFNGKWLEKFPWLEYSENDKAYCFPCFLFENNHGRQTLFTSFGFDNWRRVGGDKCVFKKHIGKTGSPLYKSMQDWISLKHVCGHIEKAINPQPREIVRKN